MNALPRRTWRSQQSARSGVAWALAHGSRDAWQIQVLQSATFKPGVR